MMTDNGEVANMNSKKRQLTRATEDSHKDDDDDDDDGCDYDDDERNNNNNDPTIVEQAKKHDGALGVSRSRWTGNVPKRNFIDNVPTATR
jgi:hypothetical protein